MMDDKNKILGNCKFTMNEIVLCYEPDPIKARMLYDAKILDADVTKDDKGRKSFEYYIHFQGWNKTWDRWILENQILKANETNRILQSKLYNEAIRPKKRKPKSSKHDSGDEKDDKSVGSTGSRNSVSGEDDVKVIQLPMISLDIPRVLAVRLEDDCYNIKRKKKLIRLPRKPTVNDIFNEYYSHCETFVKTQDGRNTSLKIIYELVQGLNTYFNYFLFTLLLYNFERDQYHNFFPEYEKQNSIADSFSPPPTPITPKLMSPSSMGFSDSKESSRSNSRTSSFCEDGNTVTNAQTKKIVAAKYNKKRKSERYLTSVDETVILEATYSKRKRNAASCSAVEGNSKDSSLGNRLTDRQQKPIIEIHEKLRTRETRSTKKNALAAEKVIVIEDSNGKLIENVEHNVIDLSRAKRVSKKCSLKEELSKKEQSTKELGIKEQSTKGQNKKEHNTKEQSTKEKCTKEPKTKEPKTKEPKTKEQKTKEHNAKEKSTKEQSTKEHGTKEQIIQEQKTKEIRTKEEITNEHNMRERKKQEETREKTTPEERTPKEGSPNERTPKEGTTKEETTEDEISKEETLKEATLDAKTLETTLNATNDTDEETDETIRQTRSSNKTSLEDDQNKEGESKENNQVNKECLENGNADNKINKDNSEDGKAENSFDIIQLNAMESGYNRLRRSMRSQKTSNTVSESDEHESLPVGSTAKSLQEAYKEPIKSASTKGQSRLKETERVDKTFMAYPQSADGETPADIYGIEHLLRLFVKFPVLLSSSNIDDPKMVVILQYVSHFLEYLSKRTDLLVDPASLYSESII